MFYERIDALNIRPQRAVLLANQPYPQPHLT